MTVASRKALAVLNLLLLGACSSEEINIEYRPQAQVTPAQDDAAKVRIGQFIDRRGEKLDWIADIRGRYYFPKVTIRTRYPVAQVVRDVVESSVKHRNMLAARNDPSEFQLYGRINAFHAELADEESVHVDLVIRLLDTDSNRDAYNATHSVDLRNLRIYESPDILKALVEDALAEVIAKSLDDPAFRQALQAAS